MSVAGDVPMIVVGRAVMQCPCGGIARPRTYSANATTRPSRPLA
jgi:hypothetical protein